MIEIDVEQGTVEWFQYRHGIPTASRASDIITPAKGALSASSYLYAGELIEEIQNPGDNDDRVTTYWMERGSVLEAEAIAWYEMQTGVTVQPGGIILADDKRRAVSPDGKIQLEDAKTLLEVKCLSPKHHVKALLNVIFSFHLSLSPVIWFVSCSSFSSCSLAMSVGMKQTRGS